MARASVQGLSPGRWLALGLGLLIVGGLLAFTGRPTLAKDPPAAEPKGEAVKASADSSTADVVKEIDEKLEAGWKDNKLTPSERCSDYEFIRRVSIDIIGRIAKPEEIETFLKDPPATRRALLIERLLGSEEYAKEWANLWSNWLLTRSGPFGRGKYKEETQVWLEDQFAQNVKYDKLVTALLTAEGKNSENGAVNFVLAHMGEMLPDNRQKEEGEFEMVPLTSRVTRLFLGIQTQCTQCHDHPFDSKLKQQHFWGINAYLRQVVREPKPPRNQDQMMALGTIELRDDPNNNPDGLVYFETRQLKELQTKATFLDGTRLPVDEEKHPISGLARRQELARRIVEHPSFPKAYANRLWAHFFGRGFTQPVDDFNEQNVPSNPELLDELGDKFAHYGYDQKKLIRWICNSRAYSLSSVANKTNDKPEVDNLFSRMPLKAMTPESLFESLMVATQAETTKEGKKELRDRWLGALIANFGDDEGNEVVFNATVVQALLMMNSNDINDAIAPKEKGAGTVSKAMARHNGQMRPIVQDLYLAALNRPPTAKDYTRVTQALTALPVKDANPAAAYHDIFWALLNSNEFILNH